MTDDTCDVSGCSNEPVRSLPSSRVSKYLEVPTGGGKGRRGSKGKKRVHLCQDHYKEYKKSAKKDREIERLGW